MIRHLMALGVGAVAAMLVLPLLGAAGAVGLAVGFCAQSLAKDDFTGFFSLFEDQIRTGDIVRIAELPGTVEDITLRHLRLRNYEGHLDFIPNGLITAPSSGAAASECSSFNRGACVASSCGAQRSPLMRAASRSPNPQRTVHAGVDKKGGAPVRPLRMAEFAPGALNAGPGPNVSPAAAVASPPASAR